MRVNLGGSRVLWGSTGTTDVLTRLKIDNFKAWREADLKFAKVTGFFGANSAGKSSLLQLLLLLKQTRNATDRGLVLDFGGPGALVNLGTFADVVHQHNAHDRMSWLIDWTLPKPLQVFDVAGRRGKLLFESDQLQARSEVGMPQTGGRKPNLSAFELGYRFAGVEFSLRSNADSAAKYELTAEGGFEFIRNRGRPWPLPRPVKTHLFPAEMRSHYQNADFLADFELAYEDLMDSIYYLGPLREHPHREYHWGGANPEDVGPRGERTVDAILAATRDDAKRSLGKWKRRKTFQEMIAHWLNELGLIREFRLEEIAKGTNLYQAIVRTSTSSVPTSLIDVGFGVSQVLPALVLLYYVPEGSTVLLEQPEIHLHPAVQSGLADVMLNVAKARHVQIIVESHSEHLMRRLQRRVAEGKAAAEEVKLYFIDSKRGVASAADLVLNEWGEIENWPDHFFGDEMGEIAATTRASLQRQLEQS